MIDVEIEGKIYHFVSAISLEEILSKIDLQTTEMIVAGVINNQIYDLTTPLRKSCKLKFLSINDEIGNRIYRHSLFLVLIKAVYDLFPGSKLSIEHSLSNGIYCELHKESPLSKSDLNKVNIRMKELIKANLPIIRRELEFEEVIQLFQAQGLLDKVNLLYQLQPKSCPVYELDGFYDYLYYNLVPRTGYLKKFDLHYKMPGFILLYPQRGNSENVPQFIEQPKLANIFHEYEKWGDIIGVGNVSELNRIISENKFSNLIRIVEALHEKKIAKIADEINNDIYHRRIILIAGPSSSGKTTFAQRLAIQLRVNGLRPVAISTDNYFVNRKETPLDDQGNYDFEDIKAIDLELFNEHLVKLLQGEMVEIPIFNFQQGCREKRGKFLQIEKDQPIIIEGIHSLNDRLTDIIPQENKFKIYISALTQLNLDRHNCISTTDTRLIRRIVRDKNFRGHSAQRTLKWWPRVRKGEEINIFPYQENADIMFNSALVYELAVLKKYAEPLLENINPAETGYYQAQRLLEFLRCFIPMPEQDIPLTSIIKEFIGGSCFR